MSRPSLRKPGWRGHLEGWQLGVVVVAMAWFWVLLIVPRAAEPHSLPLPTVDRREQARQHLLDRALCLAARHEGLAFEVRAVGERLRRYGLATTNGDPVDVAHEQESLQAAVRAVRERHGDAPLVTLRAVQTDLFLAALRRWEASKNRDPELDELGGNFIQIAQANGWLAEGHLVLTTDERRVYFQVRWGHVTGLLEEEALAPTLNDWRTYYGFLLEHPERDRLGRGKSPLMAYVVALERRDPRYPALLARGVLHYEEGNYGAAAEAFRWYLAQEPGGTRRSWARNFLMATVQHLPTGDR